MLPAYSFSLFGGLRLMSLTYVLCSSSSAIVGGLLVDTDGRGFLDRSDPSPLSPSSSSPPHLFHPNLDSHAGTVHDLRLVDVAVVGDTRYGCRRIYRFSVFIDGICSIDAMPSRRCLRHVLPMVRYFVSSVVALLRIGWLFFN